MNNIHPSLQGMAWPIHELDFLEGNPRKGNVDAIAASYMEFGQVKPIVAKKNKDGSGTVIAGNHQLMAAIKLGWDKIAVVFLDSDDKQAIAFALADNRTMELGYTDDDLLHKMLTEVSADFGELWDGLGWDEFEMAAMDERIVVKKADEINSAAYIPPVIVNQTGVADKQVEEQIASLVTQDDDGQSKLIAPSGIDHTDVVLQGSSVAVPGAAPRAIVSVQLVFDDAEQQRKWYDFIRWLRNEPSIDGTTTSQRLINFIDAHANT